MINLYPQGSKTCSLNGRSTDHLGAIYIVQKNFFLKDINLFCLFVCLFVTVGH